MGNGGVKNAEKLPTSFMDGPKGCIMQQCQGSAVLALPKKYESQTNKFTMMLFNKIFLPLISKLYVDQMPRKLYGKREQRVAKELYNFHNSDKCRANGYCLAFYAFISQLGWFLGL